MDISEFLASMQPNATDRALQRSSTMAIPDADGDPNTKDAAPPLAPGAVDDAGGAADESQPDESLPDEQQDDDQSQPVTSFAEGGEVDDDGDDDANADLMQAANEQPDDDGDGDGDEVTGGGNQGAIPDDENTDDGGGAVTAAHTPAGEDPHTSMDDWKNAAHAAISKAIDYGYNALHGVNRGMGGEQDEDHTASVKALLSGQGALSPDQWDAALKGVDPENSLDPQTKQLKGIGELDKFYSQKGPEQGAAAVWSALQLQRKKADLYRSHAVHSLDQGDDERGARSAEGAFNAVASGVLTKITAGAKAAGAYVAGKYNDARTAREDRENQSGGIADQAGQKDIGTLPSADGKKRITEQNSDGTFHVELVDPDTRKTISARDLTKEQLTHVLSQGGFTDRALHQGPDTMVGMASEVQKGQGDHLAARARFGQDVVSSLRNSGNLPTQYGVSEDGRPVGPDGTLGRKPQKSFGQQMGDANGMPGMDLSGMSTSQIRALKARFQAQQIKDAAPTHRYDADRQSRETINRDRMQSAERIAGMPARAASAPAQAHLDERQAIGQAAKDAANETFPLKDGTTRQQFLQQRKQELMSLHSNAQPQQQQPQGGGDAAHPPQSMGGHNYTWDPTAISPKTGQRGAYVRQK